MNEENEDFWLAFDHGNDSHHGPAVNASKDEDKDGQPPREHNHGYAIHHGPTIISHYGSNHHHGPAVMSSNIQLQSHSSRHSHDNDNSLAMMAPVKLEQPASKEL